MRYTSLVLAFASAITTVTADCSASWARPDDGEIALYHEEDCNGAYLNVGALFSCQSWPDFDSCSAITRIGVTCDIYKTDGCNEDYIATIDSAGYRAFCGGFYDTVQSVRCRPV